MNEKLVRDRIPELMHLSEKDAMFRPATSDKEFEHFLKLKLLEEALELSTSTLVNDVEEIADILEVLDAFLQLKGLKWENLTSLKQRKATERGKFDKRLIMMVETAEPGKT
jgi:predicted house-cleaning noncanonical NTP pyrophosphatase (MazG superfamily)